MTDRLTAALTDRYRLEWAVVQACPERPRGGGLAARPGRFSR